MNVEPAIDDVVRHTVIKDLNSDTWVYATIARRKMAVGYKIEVLKRNELTIE
ncbi:hypothetical protein D043_2060 [Vibrio parahaemolyticus EKP-021]|nr:hypothetical protein D043_2060 [Vibrio parahaemolyticus EKP-021]